MVSSGRGRIHGSRCRTSDVAKMAATGMSRNASSTTESLIDILLQTVEGTNRGATSSRTEKDNVISIVEQILASSGPPPSPNDPRLYTCFSVLYSATPKSSQQKSPAVGGYLRSPLGRLLFQTTGLFQHLIQPDVIVNLLQFRLFGFIKGMVTLYGNVSADENDTRNLEINFETPRTRIGGALFQYGETSRLSLRICYIDDRIRIDRGTRGTYIVFLRRPSPDSWPEADSWKQVVSAKALPTWILPLILVSIGAVSFRAPLVVRIFVISLLMAVAGVLSRGRTAPKYASTKSSVRTLEESK